MIVGVAVCPGAPFLVEGAATAILRSVPDLSAACCEGVERLPPADRTVLITARFIATEPIGSSLPNGTGRLGDAPNPAWRIFPPGTTVHSSVTRRDIAAPGALTLPPGAAREGTGDGSAIVAGGPAAFPPSVATLVGAHVLRAARHPTPTSALEVIGAEVPSLAALPPELGLDERDRVTLLVIADGAACHGDHAPGRRDDRSAIFDEAVARALAAGDPEALRDACRNPVVPADAVMASVGPLALLADLTIAGPPDGAELLYTGAPFGVGYFVASWRWTRT